MKIVSTFWPKTTFVKNLNHRGVWWGRKYVCLTLFFLNSLVWISQFVKHFLKMISDCVQTTTFAPYWTALKRFKALQWGANAVSHITVWYREEVFVWRIRKFPSTNSIENSFIWPIAFLQIFMIVGTNLLLSAWRSVLRLQLHNKFVIGNK